MGKKGPRTSEGSRGHSVSIGTLSPLLPTSLEQAPTFPETVGRAALGQERGPPRGSFVEKASCGS